MNSTTSILPSILIIDDEPSNTLLLKRVLGKLKCEIITCTNGWDGIDTCKEHQFAVILLDIMMPEINGYETLVRIKASTMNKDTPVFFMTGMETDQDLLIKAYKAGVVDFIQKPMNLNVLSRKIKYFLDFYIQTEELKVQRQKTEDLMKSRMSLVANITHELRTPLFAMIGMVDVLQNTELTDSQKALIKKISMNSENLLGTVNEFLDFSKTEASNNVIENEYFSLIKLCSDIIDIMAYQYHKSSSVDLSFSYDHDIPEFVRADKKKIRHILMNLFSNALKHTSEGFVKLNIRSIGMKEGKTIIKFIVEDSGTGIPKDKLKVIFEEYGQAHSDGQNVASTGLGLSISNKLVNVLGGNIKARSKEGEGSSFSFSIPIESSEESKITEIKESYTLDELLGDHKVSILITDDVPDNLFVLKNYLNTSKINLTLEHEPIKALNILKSEEEFDIVLLDLNTPLLDGFELKLQYNKFMEGKTNNKSPHFIALSAFTLNEELEEKLAHLGINDYLMKPVKKEELYKKIVTLAHNLNSDHEVSIKEVHDDKDLVDYRFDSLDDDFLEYLPTYLSNKLAEANDLKRSFEENNYEEASNICHKILGTAKSFGLFKINREIEQVQKNVKSENIQDSLEETQNLIDGCINHLLELQKTDLKS